jgi:hypothetical protein
VIVAEPLLSPQLVVVDEVVTEIAKVVLTVTLAVAVQLLASLTSTI